MGGRGGKGRARGGSLLEEPRPLTLAREFPTDEAPHVPPDTSPDLDSDPEEEDWGARVERHLAGAERRTITGGAQGGVTEQLTLPDGTKVFSKRYPDAASATGVTDDPQRTIDAEELAGMVAEAIQAPVPRVHRPGDELQVITEWVDGTKLHTARRRRDGDTRADAMLDSPDAQRLGLLDLLSHNHDRHENNMLVTKDEKVTGIDQGCAWIGANWIVKEPRFAENRIMGFLEGPGRRHFGSPNDYTALGPNPLTPGDVTELRQRLTALRPAFERRGRTEWLDASLVVLDRLASHANGTKSIFTD